MRQTVLLLLTFGFAALIAGCASSVSIKQDQYSKSQTYELDKSKDEIFVAANDWMAKNMRSSSDAIQYSDKEAGQINAKVSLRYSCGMTDNPYRTNWTVSVKDRALKIKVDPISVYSEILESEIVEIKEKCAKKADIRLEKAMSDLERSVRNYESF